MMLPLTTLKMVLGPWGAVASGAWTFATSRVGSVLIVGLLAYGYGDYRTNNAWEAKQEAALAALKKAHADELAREADASRKISEAAVKRAQDGEALAGQLQGQIDDLKAQEAKEPFNVPEIRLPKIPSAADGRCDLDGDLAQRVRQLDAAAHRAAPAAHRSR